MELNERQQALYKFLNVMSFTKDYINKEQIVGRLYDYYPRYSETSNEHNSAAFALIRRDVRAINFSGAEKIIVSNNKGYKIATQEEALEYVKRKLASNLKGLKLYWNLKHKIDLNGQLNLTFHELKPFLEDVTKTTERCANAVKSFALELENN